MPYGLAMSNESSRMQFYKRAQQALHEIERLRAALKQIVDLDAAKDSGQGFNEWGEADCFMQAQQLARDALRSPMEVQEPRYTKQQVADACMQAEISDGHCESLLIALTSRV